MAGSQASGIAGAVGQLCPHCAMCCNGVLFKDVEVQPADDAAVLVSLGLPLTKRGKLKFPQPCAALHGCTCRIYPDRPARCREFECALLKAVMAGKTTIPAALRVIRETRKRADRVKELLQELGDSDDSRPLSLRFRRMQKRCETARPDRAMQARFGELTLAMHDLNLLLREKFHPSPGDGTGLSKQPSSNRTR